MKKALNKSQWNEIQLNKTYPKNLSLKESFEDFNLNQIKSKTYIQIGKGNLPNYDKLILAVDKFIETNFPFATIKDFYYPELFLMKMLEKPKSDFIQCMEMLANTPVDIKLSLYEKLTASNLEEALVNCGLSKLPQEIKQRKKTTYFTSPIGNVDVAFGKEELEPYLDEAINQKIAYTSEGSPIITKKIKGYNYTQSIRQMAGLVNQVIEKNYRLEKAIETRCNVVLNLIYDKYIKAVKKLNINPNKDPLVKVVVNEEQNLVFHLNKELLIELEVKVNAHYRNHLNRISVQELLNLNPSTFNMGNVSNVCREYLEQLSQDL